MKKSELTKKRILDTAIEVFKDKRYGNGSIREIASKMGIKNSTIYYYFKNKEEIYKGLIESFSKGLCESIRKEAFSVNTTSYGLIRKIVEAYVNYISNNRNLYDIFREVEFVDLQFAKKYYEEVTNCILESFDGKLAKGIDPKSISYAILGSIYFITIKNLIWSKENNIKKDMEVTMKVIESGIDRHGDFKPYIVKEKKYFEIQPPFNTRGEKTKKTILKTAEKLFGENGYQATQIADISRTANTGLGTFYLYFKSKKEVLSEVIKLVNHALRNNSWEYTKDFDDRREIENAGMQAFFNQFKSMGKDYRIVRESEFVDKNIGTWYYMRIASSYVKGLKEGMKNGEIVLCDAEALAYVLMGISHTVGINWFVLNGEHKMNNRDILSVIEFTMHGLKGILKEDK
jgi:AcrR family transcriptional regulator